MALAKVMVADDQPLILEALTARLALLGMPITAVAPGGLCLLDTFVEAQPDVLVLDVKLQAGSGLGIARQLLSRAPNARLVFFAQQTQMSIISDVYRLGARGYVTKDMPISILADSIRTAHRGDIYFMPGMAERVATTHERSPYSLLAEREMAVFKLMATGLSIQEIASALRVTRKTAGLICAAVRSKLSAPRSADITRLAVRYEVIDA